ncbi:MAG: putative diaminopimelate decarboxylase, partial [Steroidobacteraceae bacterium]|nr:putative diaminopimelate decarboxylase [Steroidobacteraceae bacterium]
VYCAARVRDNLMRLRTALASHGVEHDAFFAIKANRYAPLVTYLKLLGRCGIDACSPAELRYAREVGFEEAEISYTGTSVSESDLDCLQRHPGVHINCDSLSTIRRLGQRCPGRRIGIRVNPELGAGYNDMMRYAGEKATKFGIYRDRFEEAIAVAHAAGMRVETMHFHFGSGYIGNAVEVLDQVLERVGALLDAHPEIRTLNIGGGLGVRLAETEISIDLERWAAIVARHVVRRGLRVQVEPGDYLMKDAGVLLVRVNTVEDKAGTRFVGIDAGFNIQNLAAYYHTPFIVAPLGRAAGAPLVRVTIAGNINEAIDLLAEDVELPALAEGDLLALLNVGGYGSSASSNHCMRGEFREYLLLDEAKLMEATGS